MKQYAIIGMAGLLMSSGCISIKTYEEKIKFCRDLTERSKVMKEEVGLLRRDNRTLKRTLKTAEVEQEQLKQEIMIQAEEMQNIRGTYDQLINELKEDISRGEVSVQAEGQQLRIVMEERIVFRSGSARLQKQGRSVIDRIADILKTAKNHLIRVEGHTDNIPIKGRLARRYPSNWELSAARAATVIRQLERNGGIRPENLVLTAFSEHRPIQKNESKAGREQNRRVEITLIPMGG